MDQKATSPYYGAVYNTSNEIPFIRNSNKAEYLIPKEDHFINDKDYNTWTGEQYNRPDPYDSPNITGKTPFFTRSGKKAPTYSGSATPINRTKDMDKENVIKFGLENAELNRVNNKPAGGDLSAPKYTMNSARQYTPPPLTPMQPFYRMMDPKAAQTIVNHAYNRFQLPIADLEHRKAFRNLFFTRPECYIMCSDTPGTHNKWGLSAQCERDDDIASSCSRMPHICKLLSPVYITGTFGTNFAMDNFNYLLSNRATGFAVPDENLSVVESMSKSIEGYTVSPGMQMESHQGGSFTITFRDTKFLEVYEYHRLWMIYIAKRKRGIFEPPFARYNYSNNFPVSFGKLTPSDLAFLLHPYDRALEYTASLFDVITNESNDRIMYWCKYYGIYPTQVSISGLNSDNGGVLASDLSVSVTYRYQYKLPCTNKTLVEFNFNAGVTNSVGKSIDPSNLNVSSGYINDKTFIKFKDPKSTYTTIKNVPYAGSGGMFTGTPYIVMGRFNQDISNVNGHGDFTVHPYLRFMGVNNKMINNIGNLGYHNTTEFTDENKLIGID
jgi:hypothetical protein